MTYKEQLIEEWQKQLLLEMAITRRDFFLKLEAVYETVTEHLILALVNKEDENYNHWCSEIYGNFGRFLKLKYRHNKYPTAEDFKEVFLDTWFECLDDRLESYIEEAYEREEKETPELNPDQIKKLRNNIKSYLNWVITNVNPQTGEVNKSQAYKKLKELCI
ncbi:MAG: hypothetical protein ACI4PU_00665 [Intestinibacter sp.]